MAVQIIGSTSAVNPDTALPKPAGTVDGDLILSFGTALADDQGFTQYASIGNIISWKVAAGEPSSWPFKTAGMGCAVTVRGCSTDPDSWLYGGDLTSLTAPSLSGVGAVLLCWASAQAGSYTLTAMPAGMTNLGYHEISGSAKRGIAGLLNPPNPTGTRAFTGSGTYKSAIALLLPDSAAPSGFFQFF